MGAMDQISEKVRGHIRKLVTTAGLPDTEESLEAIAQGWIEKKDIFERQVAEMNMSEVESTAAEDERGCLVLTYSGSLLNIGPMVNGHRACDYASIGLRRDVPDFAQEEESELDSDVEVDRSVLFSKGPIQKSSPIFKIAVPPEEMEAEEQIELLSDVTQILTEDFVEVNKTIVVDE